MKNRSCNQDLESAGFKPQVHVRPCNLFHLSPGGRHRLVSSEEGWASLGGAQWKGAEDLCQAIASHPEAFSPNALLRPVYQSLLLPDVALVGGLAPRLSLVPSRRRNSKNARAPKLHYQQKPPAPSLPPSQSQQPPPEVPICSALCTLD